MHFGLVSSRFRSAFLFLLFVYVTVVFISCKSTADLSRSVSFKLPEQGQMIPLATPITIKLDVPQGTVVKAATYLLDGKAIAVKTNADSILIPTGSLSVGYKLITAIVDNGVSNDTLTVNVVLKSNVKPAAYTYMVDRVLPHDTSSYTQGLEYHNGKFLESTGLQGSSTIRWVEPGTGKALQKVSLAQKYFGEGATLIDNKIVMLTWQNNMGLIYDAKTLVQEATFPYQDSREGWGLCFNGTQLVKSDGTNKLYFLNKTTFKEESAVEVYDNEGPVDALNELEYIDGKVYANVYTKDYIVVIDPKTGIVEKKIDMTGLLAKGYTRTEADTNIDVLNGIACDATNKKLYVTGKKWPKLFEITLVPQ